MSDDYETGFHDGEHDSDYVKLLESYICHATGLNVRYNKDDLEYIKSVVFPEKSEIS